MAPTSFETRTCGKWILAGEHTVLRGGRALVFPLREMTMSFRWLKTTVPFKVELVGDRGSELSLIFYGLLEEALKKLGRGREHLSGELHIESNIRLGAGLGASAALCVGLSRFLVHLGYLPDANVETFARQLENMFHGESSGVDIAVATLQRPIVFSRKNGIEDLAMKWKPYWYLSYSGKRGVTAECVKKVKDLWESDPTLAQRIDDQMLSSVNLALEAFRSDEATGLPLLIRSIEMANNTFVQWKLTEGALDLHLKDLFNRGALAAKPTGSGGGGYVLSLWPNRMSAEDLIPV